MSIITIKQNRFIKHTPFKWMLNSELCRRFDVSVSLLWVLCLKWTRESRYWIVLDFKYLFFLWLFVSMCTIRPYLLLLLGRPWCQEENTHTISQTHLSFQRLNWNKWSTFRYQTDSSEKRQIAKFRAQILKTNFDALQLI